jgi:DNA repair protein RecN (Recombination protein N)
LAVQKSLQAIQIDEDEKRRKQDWLQYQIDEINQVQPQADEDETLATERKRLGHAADAQSQLSQALDQLSDGQPNALHLLQQIQSVLTKPAQNDADLAGILKQLADATLVLEETQRDLSDHAMNLRADPERLHALDERLNVLYGLQRKHGKSLAEIHVLQEEMEAEIEQLLDLDTHVAQKEAQLDQLFKNLQTLSVDLGQKRHLIATDFAQAVTQELSDLGMPHARFEVSFGALKAGMGKTVHHNDTLIGRYGNAQISFSFAANPGQKMGPLNVVASGGELSRTLLSLKRVLQMADPVPITVFDEVDAGVGGAIGEVIGKKLAQIGQLRQVFCVTHLAQIAAQADEHCQVAKEIRNGETETVVNILKREERILEVARMIGGAQMTEVTLEHASEMVQSGTQRMALS